MTNTPNDPKAGEAVRREMLGLQARYHTGWLKSRDGWTDAAIQVYVRASDYDALLAERDALLKDASRYRWLRDTGAVFATRASGGDGMQCECIDIGRPAHGLDAAIDAALTRLDGQPNNK